MRRVDRTGERFGRLVVTARAAGYKRTHWACQCDCGNASVVSNSNLANGNTKSCGCMWTEKVRGDMDGKRFGKLIVIEFSGSHKSGKTLFTKYRCGCDCGGEIITFGMSLRNGDTISCGCAYADAGDLRRKSEDHKHAVAMKHVRRRRAARIKAYRPFDFELFEMVESEVYSLAKLRTVLTGVPHQVDHIVPLNSKHVCGLHSEHNFQVLTASANSSKRNMHWPDMPGKET